MLLTQVRHLQRQRRLRGRPGHVPQPRRPSGDTWRWPLRSASGPSRASPRAPLGAAGGTAAAPPEREPSKRSGVSEESLKSALKLCAVQVCLGDKGRRVHVLEFTRRRTALVPIAY